MTADEAMRIRMAATDVVANWDRWRAVLPSDDVYLPGGIAFAASLERLREAAAEPQPADA